MSVPDAVRGGELLPSLEAVRDQIAADLDECASMRDKAALYTRLVDVLARIDEIRPPTAKDDPIDEIAARRNSRRTSPAKNPACAEGAKQRVGGRRRP